jgi:hypothetical protein
MRCYRDGTFRTKSTPEERLRSKCLVRVTQSGRIADQLGELLDWETWEASMEKNGFTRVNKHDRPYPHEGGCIGCRDARPRLCNVCGKPKGSGCTNGRCDKRHAANCTGGGDTSPGHGFGKVA